MQTQNPQEYLTQLAAKLMREKGLEPEFPKEVQEGLKSLKPLTHWPAHYQDLRNLSWCSIDNDDSLDLDQLTYASKEGDQIRLYVAIADVDILVPKNSSIDRHAEINTTSVYTPAKVFPMLPTKLSTDLTSLNEGQERGALVLQIKVDPEGAIQESSIAAGVVQNKAKLTYSSIGGWLGKENPLPDKVRKVDGLENTLLLQHEAAQALKKRRQERGALTLESPEAEAKMADQEIHLSLSSPNFAHQLIEELMIAANSCMVDHFKKGKIPSLRRVVRVPKRWDRIREIAVEFGKTLPLTPDPKALDLFLTYRKQADPLSFPDLSLTIIKLLGNGEYVVENPQAPPLGHFGLALRSYTHATAPNRRYPDLISQRQYKAYLASETNPYSFEELQELAQHCTQQEDAATKVERQINKSAAAMLLSPSIGQIFKGIITGSGEKGTWVRIFEPPVEGKVIKDISGLDVGHKINVKLVSVDVEKGYIDFIPV